MGDEAGAEQALAGDEADEFLLLSQMVGAMDAKLDEYGYREESMSRWGLTPYELLTVASIIAMRLRPAIAGLRDRSS